MKQHWCLNVPQRKSGTVTVTATVTAAETGTAAETVTVAAAVTAVEKDDLNVTGTTSVTVGVEVLR